ncbi:9904_t:CDS:2 [Acaulospora morrowiae]|uniref:9904_t:CDS:1 n=1 Tax=Acaulospora morrowiae TaxID=94023 RepID=A0A9N9CHP8_9GLOM|nr:9904_t:CDS:2 [Acaulospora morrowiae]
MHLFSSIKRNLILTASLILFCKISSYQLDFAEAVKLSREFHDYDDENLRNKLFIKNVKKDAQLIGFTDIYNNSTDDTNYVAVVNVVAVIFGNFDLVACSYVIYSAYIKGRTQSLSMSDRVPLYLSISDVGQYILFMPNFVYSMIYNHTISGFGCKVIAYLFFLQMNIDLILMTSISVITYLRVVKRSRILLGSYDWKFFVSIMLLSIALSSPSIASVGPSRYWCLTNVRSVNVLLIDDYVLFIIAFVITCFCYLQTLYTIFNVDREEMTDSSERIDRWNKLERQAIKKIMIYITLFMMKWIPLMTFGIGIMSGYEDIWIFILFVISFNLGGICNCILYLMNGDSPEHNDSAPEQATNSTASLSQKTNTHQSEVCQITLPPEAYIPQNRDSMADSVILNLEEKVIRYPPSGSSEQNNYSSMVGDDESSGSDDDEIRVIGVT